MGGGEGCTDTNTLHGPCGKGGHFLLIFKVIITSNLEKQSTPNAQRFNVS